MKQRSYNLMKRWCDKLLKYEIKSEFSELDGALLCPCCHVVHGRIADLVYPLSTLWLVTGDNKYIEAAERFVNFTEYNLKRQDGSYRNDLGNTWKGTSVFSAIALGDTIMELGDRLPEGLHRQWREIFIRLSDFAMVHFDNTTANINYFAGTACLLALAYKVTGNREYLEKANCWEEFCHKRFDENKLFYGELHETDFVSKGGCRAIDIGYNLEESLPLLLRYSLLAEDDEKLDFYKECLMAHFEFLLPDGGINNTFGIRHSKWTYWGSRTSDGLIEGLVQLIDEPVFARASEKVLSLWEKCTHDDLLSLPMTDTAKERTCIHHAFCHAKSLAALYNSHKTVADTEACLLPSETPHGVMSYQSGRVLSVSVADWRGSFSAVDVNHPGSENGGGSMTFLWHKSVGAICAATMHTYLQLEPYNMQLLRNRDVSECMTPHLVVNGKDTLLDNEAVLSYTKDNRIIAVGNGWSVEYEFSEKELVMTITAKDAQLVLPVICSSEVTATLDGTTFTAGSVVVRSDEIICADVAGRVFNQVGGFEYIPLTVAVKEKLRVEISVC